MPNGSSKVPRRLSLLNLLGKDGDGLQDYPSQLTEGEFIRAKVYILINIYTKLTYIHINIEYTNKST